MISTKEDLIIKIIDENSPKSNIEVIFMAINRYQMEEEEIINILLDLKKKKKILFKNQDDRNILNLMDYIISEEANWYKTATLLTILSFFSSLLIKSNTPLLFLRFVFGLPIIFFLPGFAILKNIIQAKEMDNLESITLSIGISLVWMAMIGLFLSFTPIKIRLFSVIFSQFITTLILLNIGLIREYNNIKKD